MMFVSCSATKQLARIEKHFAKHGPYDVVIVPGVPYDETKYSELLETRMYWAKFLYDNGYTRHIMFSGGAVYTPYIEAAVMQIMADSMGIPRSATLTESCAEHSTENAYFGFKLAQYMGFKKIAIATDPFQSAYIKMFIGHKCKGLESVPVQYGIVKFRQLHLPAIDASEARIDHAFVHKTEKHNRWHRMLGSLGRKINYLMWEPDHESLAIDEEHSSVSTSEDVIAD